MAWHKDTQKYSNDAIHTKAITLIQLLQYLKIMKQVLLSMSRTYNNNFRFFNNESPLEKRYKLLYIIDHIENIRLYLQKIRKCTIVCIFYFYCILYILHAKIL
jgi:hypothetical protein